MSSTPQVSSVNILVANKIKLVEWLSSDLHIIQHAQADGIIDHRVYKSLNNTAKLTTEEACTQLIDTMIDRGEGTSAQFLELLRKPEILNTYPQLKGWNAAFALPGAGPSTQGATGAGQPPAKRVLKPGDHPVDQLRKGLIKKVTEIGLKNILDQLLDDRVINKEGLHTVNSKPTKEDKARELFELLGTDKEKEGLYQALKDLQPDLLEELELNM